MALYSEKSLTLSVPLAGKYNNKQSREMRGKDLSYQAGALPGPPNPNVRRLGTFMAEGQARPALISEEKCSWKLAAAGPDLRSLGSALRV